MSDEGFAQKRGKSGALRGSRVPCPESRFDPKFVEAVDENREVVGTLEAIRC
jgi:hypothetical protein